MNRSYPSSMVATLVAASICFLAPHAANAQRQSKGGKTNDTYFVVHILNPPEDQVNGRTANGQNPTDQQVDLTKEYMVLAASELKTKQETYDKDYKTRIEKWNEERKNGVIDADTPKPPKTTIKKLRTFKLKDVADEYLKKTLDDLSKKEGDKPAAGGKPTLAK